VSAPVFGRPGAAQSRDLIIVAAAESELLERCRPLFNAMAQQTVTVGQAPWQANAIKLCGNFMIAGMIEAFGEAFATLRKAAIDPHLFLQITNGLFRSPVYENYGQTIADEHFDPAGFALKLGLKDLRLLLATADECAAPMPLASLIRDHLVSAVANGQQELDWSSVARVAARDAGLS
jgi:3-hydroxyisobutyrate dehydrogenase-like beta-hydroxyacid dehydrogenase